VKFLAPVLPMALDLFFEGKKDRYHPVSLLPVTIQGPDRLRRMRTFSFSGDLSLADDRLVLTAGARHEWSENEFYDEPFMPWLPPTPLGKTEREELSPHGGFRFQPFPWVTLKGNIGEHYRVPTFFELFGNRGNVTGAPDLENETGTNRDIGVIFSHERFLCVERPFLEIAYMHNDVENLILFFPNSQRTMRPKNIGSARMRGIELSLSGTFYRSIRFAGNYSYLDGEDTGPIPYYNGNELAGRPAHQGALEIELTRRLWSVLYEWNHIGSNYLDRANREEVPERNIHNVSVTLRHPRHGITLTVEGRNIGDRRISDVSGYPLPGRSIYATLKLSR
jgi:outer membrane receptor protein involved in Fe transport